MAESGRFTCVSSHKLGREQNSQTELIHDVSQEVLQANEEINAYPITSVHQKRTRGDRTHQMKLRSHDGKRREKTKHLTYPDARCSDEEESDVNPFNGHYPLLARKGHDQYVPWTFMDMVGLAGRLPELTEGANKWILTLEESTGGFQLALGDIKALLMHVAGKHVTVEIFTSARLPALGIENALDPVPFGLHRNDVWKELRKQFPEKMDASKLEGEVLKDDESPSKFLRLFQRTWREETGSQWNANIATENIFKMMVKKAMPQEVQKRLDTVVGLAKMPWELYEEHIVHHVERCRKEKQQLEEQEKQVCTKLTQLQLGELTEKKKNKGKIQAPVVSAAELPSREAPFYEQEVAVQGPAIPHPSNSAGQEVQTLRFPPLQVTVDVQPSGGGHVNQQWTTYRPQVELGQGRGRGAQRGTPVPTRGGRGRAQGAPPGQSPYIPPELFRCYGCGQLGHIHRVCPTNPWTGPAANIQQ